MSVLGEIMAFLARWFPLAVGVLLCTMMFIDERRHRKQRRLSKLHAAYVQRLSFERPEELRRGDRLAFPSGTILRCEAFVPDEGTNYAIDVAFEAGARIVPNVEGEDDPLS